MSPSGAGHDCNTLWMGQNGILSLVFLKENSPDYDIDRNSLQ